MVRKPGHVRIALGGQGQMKSVKLVERPTNDPFDITVLELDAEDNLVVVSLGSLRVDNAELRINEEGILVRHQPSEMRTCQT